MRYFIQILLIISILLLGVSCGSDDPTGPGEGDGRLVLYLADAPTDVISEVNLQVEGIEIYSEQNGWVEVKNEAAIYNLLELTNGKVAVTADVNVEAAVYSTVRIHIGGDSHIVVDGGVVNLSLSSGFQGGVELDYQISIESGTTTEILIDIDAHRSVTGSLTGGFTLQPVIRIQSLDNAGNISGQITPIDARAIVIASQNDEVVTSTYADEETGEFMLVGLASGEYDIKITPRNKDYNIKGITGVVVEAGETTDLGHIELEEIGSPND